MKKIKIIIISLIGFLSYSCGDMLESVQPFLDEGEKIYVGRVAAFTALPGDNRIELVGLLPYGVTQTKCLVSWINPEGQPEELEVPINRDELETIDFLDEITGEVIESYPYLSIMLDENMKEGEYQFTIVTFDAQGNKSIPDIASGYVYGDLYRNTLSNRIISQVSSVMVTEGGLPVFVDGKLAYNALIAWRAFYDSQALGSELSYELEDGTFETIFIPSADLQTTIPYSSGYKKNGKIEWRTVYKPVPQAIDEFYTGLSEAALPAN